jgi:tRNA A-37 threonylcarbamoyl transferase component Bud32
MTEWLERVRGELAGRYRIERELGRGSTATVYLADDLAQQRQVAVKVLHPELVQAVGGQRFLREIRLAASLHHPHLLAIHDSGEANGLFYFVAPYLPDGSLRTCLNRDRQLSVDEAMRITREIADALSYVHEHGIVHRDIKPENILFAGKHACVADFGIARAIEVVLGDTLTSTGLVVGTPAYMSPEQASGERAVDARSDQYSLACVLYEMLAGVPPFVGATAQSVISQRFAHAPSPLTFYRPHVPPGIDSAVARALEIAPADRFDSVRDFVAALDRRAPPVVRIDPAVRLHKLRRRWFAAGAAAAMVVIAVFGFDQACDQYGGALCPTSDIPAAAVRGLRGVRGSRAYGPYLEGHRAFARGEFESAYQAFGEATAAEPAFAHGHLWRAQIGAFLRSTDDEAWADAARRAVTLARGLTPRDSILASALFALSDRRYLQACSDFEQARQLDSLDFLVWYGLGECRYRDSAIVSSPQSRTGWAFRSSFDAATSAYLRAADLESHAHTSALYSRLGGMLKVEPRVMRWGTHWSDSSRRYAAIPEIVAETLAFTPAEVVDAFRFPGVPRRNIAALERNRMLLAAFTRDWISAKPRDPAALETYADVLEARGELSDEIDPVPVLSAVRSARALTTDRISGLRLAGREVRVLLKRGEFQAARVLADSALRAWTAPNHEAAQVLHGLAALLGRVRETAQLGALRRPERHVAGVRLVPQLVESISRLEAYAALGVCAALDQLQSDVLANVERYVDKATAARVRAEVTKDPARWSAECPNLRASPVHGSGVNSTLRALQAFADGRNDLARTLLDSIAAGREHSRPGDVSLDYVFQELWLRSALGDTTGAIQQLDIVLQSLSLQTSALLRLMPQAAALPRTMALRAELAAARGEHDVAKRWAGSVLQLWGGADPELAPVVARMRLLASRR